MPELVQQSKRLSGHAVARVWTNIHRTRASKSELPPILGDYQHRRLGMEKGAAGV